MNQRQLSYFLEVYKRKSITQAAETLFISPQAISKTISSLEAELGVSLFIHDKNKIRPTKEASKLSIHAIKLINEYNVIEQKLFKEKDVLTPLHVPCSYDTPLLLGTQFFKEFMADYPEIILQFKEYVDVDVIRKLEKGKAEIALVSTYPNQNTYYVKKIISDSFSILVSKLNPLSQKTHVTYSELNGQKVIAKDASSVNSLFQISMLAKTNTDFSIPLEITNSRFIVEMIEKDPSFICLLSTGLSDFFLPESVVSIPIMDDDISKNIYLVHKKDIFLSVEAKIFKDAVLAFHHIE